MSFKKLDEIFEIEEETTEIEVVEEVSSEIVRYSSVDEKREKDFETVRGDLLLMMTKGKEVIDGAMDAAEMSQHPRAYEVAINAIRQLADVGDKVLDLHAKKKKMEEESDTQAPHTVNNNLFMAGTTAEVMKMISEGRRAKKDTTK
jgi:hypothetical protein